MSNIYTKIIKIKDEDRFIISTYLYFGELLFLVSPFIIDYEENGDLIFLEWIPSSINGDYIIPLYMEDIITLVNPAKILLDKYLEISDTDMELLEELSNSLIEDRDYDEYGYKGNDTLSIDQDDENLIYYPPEKAKTIH